MLKIRLIGPAETVVGDAEIEPNPAEAGRDFPDVVTFAGFSYFLDTGAAFDRSKIDAVYRRAWVQRIERVQAEARAPASIESTRTGARMALADGETPAEDVAALADAARGR